MPPTADATHAAQAVLALPTDAPPYAADGAARRALLSASVPALATLKAANRAAYEALAARRRDVRAARAGIDDAAHTLQHLVYERTQLEAQIAACGALDTVYEQVPLRPEAEFAAHAPEASRSDEVRRDAHRLLVHRLEYELAERRRLEAEAKRLEAELHARQREQRAAVRALRARQKQLSQLIEVRGWLTQGASRK